jgi:hypothetical protein
MRAAEIAARICYPYTRLTSGRNILPLANLINQYSFIALSVFLGLVVAIGLWRWQDGPLWLRLALAAAYLLGVGVARFTLNFHENYSGDLADAENILADGSPTLLMLYSNY